MVSQKHHNHVLSLLTFLASSQLIIPSDAFSTGLARKIAETRRQQHHNQQQQQGLYLAPQQLGSFETLDTATITNHQDDDSEVDDRITKRRVVLEDLVTSTPTNSGGGRVDFEEAWEWQKYLMQEHFDRLSSSLKKTKKTEGSNKEQEQDNVATSQFLSRDQAQDLLMMDIDTTNEEKNKPFVQGGLDTIFMLEHNEVYTLGTGSDEKFIIGTNPDVPVVRMDRGGEVTYHGPGQLVVYPVLDLRSYKQDIHWYMRALEECVLVALNKIGVNALRQDDTTGIWVNNHKVAAIGVKCRKWITMHGLAVNIESTSMANFEGIVPCGLEGRKVGYVNQFLSATSNHDNNNSKDHHHPDALTVREFSKYMKEALEEVFQIELQTRSRVSLPEL